MIDNLVGKFFGFFLKFVPGVGKWYSLLKAIESFILAILAAIRQFVRWLRERRYQKIDDKLDEARKGHDGTLDERLDSNKKVDDAWKDISG